MESDSLTTARTIRQPITSADDIRSAFDGITYSKGAAILEMFEDWLGEVTLRDGVRKYLARHAWGKATTHDFVTAMSAATGRDLQTTFSAFLDRPGLPVVGVELLSPTTIPSCGR